MHYSSAIEYVFICLSGLSDILHFILKVAGLPWFENKDKVPC